MLKLVLHPLRTTLLVVALLACLDASAESACPSNVSPNNPIVTATRHGLPLAQTILVEYNGDFYRIPAGYFDPWPSAKYQSSGKKGATDEIGYDLKDTNTVDGVDIRFWMPSLRYPERTNIPALRFCENGRLPTTLQSPEYVVEARIQPLDTNTKGEPLTPLRKYNNLIFGVSGGEEGHNYKNQFGLVRFENRQHPNNKTSLYRSLKDSDPEILMDCTEPAAGASNAGCNAEIYFSKNHFSLRIRFPTSELPRWQDALTSVQTLLEKWRVKGSEEIEFQKNAKTNMPSGR